MDEMKKQTSTDDGSKAKLFKQFATCYADELLSKRFMADKPNSNSVFEDAIAVQCSALISYILIIVRSPENNLTSRVQVPMALRAAIEVVANIYYFANHKSDEDLAKAYLSSAQDIQRALYNFKNKRPISPQKWCKQSIRQRIKALEREDDYSFADLYYFLSSFVHADAGYEYAYTIDYDHLDTLYCGVLGVLLVELDSILSDVGLADHDLIIPAVANAMLRNEKKSKKPSTDKIKLYESILQNKPSRSM